jgi:hypothetical protein
MSYDIKLAGKFIELGCALRMNHPEEGYVDYYRRDVLPNAEWELFGVIITETQSLESAEAALRLIATNEIKCDALLLYGDYVNNKSISILRDCSFLRRLYISAGNVSDINLLSNNRNLSELTISSKCSITDDGIKAIYNSCDISNLSITDNHSLSLKSLASSNVAQTINLLSTCRFIFSDHTLDEITKLINLKKWQIMYIDMKDYDLSNSIELPVSVEQIEFYDVYNSEMLLNQLNRIPDVFYSAGKITDKIIESLERKSDIISSVTVAKKCLTLDQSNKLHRVLLNKYYIY